MQQLIISEKPAAAAKIAAALGKPIQKKTGKAVYFEVKKNNKKIIIAPAVGHLFSLAAKKKNQYPVFDVEWTPTFEINKRAAFAKPYFKNIQKLSKGADDFVVATDYDIEGEVIGLNILKYICKQKDAKRMKFSTLTQSDLKKAYADMRDTIDWGQAEAGITRHHLDFYWGINLSKAITDALYLAIKRFKPLSIGRVQGPALAVLTERERKITKFIPKPYWQLFILLNLHGKQFQAVHEKEKFWKQDEAKKIYNKIKGKQAKITNIQKRKQTVHVPFPFDLTSLQIEAYRCFKIPPKTTLQIAQSLYTSAYISYPRTSSQKLPPSIGYKKILTNLAKQSKYKLLASKIIAKKTLRPKQGKKTDPAHPAIYPTGQIPKGLD
ncbi:DNA topoisomerase I, partial [Candidatus Woesearchaeota archaeon]|nr:DNA topoisomerase I [Candidatus Woesearchaeota archaeon]